MSEAKETSLELTDEGATRRLADDLAMVLAPGDVVALEGDLGTGKTTFARYLLRALADDPLLEVPSPTFTLSQVYEFGRLTVTHFDLYRLSSPEEVDEIGLHEAASLGACLIEWPDRAGERLPSRCLTIRLEETDDPESRLVTISMPDADWSDRLDRSFNIRRFLGDSNWRDADRRFLQGDASTRTYERIADSGRKAVLMNAPSRPDGPPVADGLPYSRIAHLAESVHPFAAIGAALRREGFSAPDLLAHDLDAGLLLLEDLGSEGIVAGETPLPERYRVAVDLLVALHSRDWAPDVPVPGGGTHHIPDYDRRAMSIEVALLTEWYVPHITGGRLGADALAAFGNAWNTCFDRLADAEKSWTLRDFHSPNLLWLANREGHQRTGLLDFQDTVVGPSAYDVASLLQDARVTVPAEMEADLLTYYKSERRLRDSGFDAERFDEIYAIMAAQRATKVLGIFARLNDRDGKPGYLRHMPRLKKYLHRSFHHPVLSDVRLWYEEHLAGSIAQ